MTDQATCDAEYDEYRGGPRTAENRISFPNDGEFYLSTKGVIPWMECGQHDTDRMVSPSAYVERLFAKCPVHDPKKLSTVKFMERCLHAKRFLVPMLDMLVAEGLLEEEDDEGVVHRIEFETYDELCKRADKIMKECADKAECNIDDVTDETGQLDWMEGFSNRAEDGFIAWFAALTLCDLTMTTGDLSLYCLLNFILGPRSTEAVRVDANGIFYAMVGTANGGQLAEAIRTFYYKALGQSVATNFLLKRLSDFLIDSEWPEVYCIQFDRWEEYAYDLPRRVAWKTATKEEWTVLALNKLPTAMGRLDILGAVFEDYLEQPAELMKEYVLLTDAIPDADSLNKQPFTTIEAVNAYLAKHYKGLIDSEVEEEHSSSDILTKLKERMRATEKSATGESSAGVAEEINAPKPGQISRALTSRTYTRLEVKWMTNLQDDKMVMDERLEMIKENLTSATKNAEGGGTILPHAVLFATKGARMSVYIGQTGADYLALLYGDRHLMSAYLGQSIVYDPDEGGVPAELKTYRFDEKQTRLLLDFAWASLDFLNGCLLEVRGREVGTEFARYSSKNVYHDGDMLNHLRELYGRLFESIGYPRDVPKEEGVSFRGFVTCIIRMQKFAIGLSTEEQRGAFAMIDDFMKRGLEAAAANGKRIVYGASPADRKLGVWVRADEPVYIEMLETLGAQKDTATYRRRMGAMHGPKPKAATLTGFSLMSKEKDEGDVSSKGPKSKSRKGKAAISKLTTGTGGGAKNDGNGGGGKGKPKATEKGSSNKEVGSQVEKKRIYVYDDGSYSIGEAPYDQPDRDSD